MTVLEDYWELGELLTIRYDPNDLSKQLERPYDMFRAFIWACLSFRQKIPWICICKKKHNYIVHNHSKYDSLDVNPF